MPCQSAPCATPTQGWYQADPSGQISRPGQFPVVRQGEIEILHPGHGEQIDSNTWAGRPRSVMNTGPWLAARLAGGGFRRWPRLGASSGDSAGAWSPWLLLGLWYPNRNRAMRWRDDRSALGPSWGDSGSSGRASWWETADDRHSLCGRARAPRKATVAPPMASWLN